MKHAPYLKEGDSIRIISTARKISVEELEPTINKLNDWGLKVEFGKNLFHEDHQFSGTEEERISDLQEALNDPNLKAILFARGGYGSVQVVDHIDWQSLKEHPKWLIGYSDITVFHSHLNRNFGIESIHAAMPINIKSDLSGLSLEGLESLKKAIFGDTLQYEFDISPHNQGGIDILEGELVGGNLSILYSLSGTPSQMGTNDKILFIEDLDEYLYHIDRMMMNLIRSGLLSNCKAILIGGMSDMNDNTIPYGSSAEEIIIHRMKPFQTPLIFGFPAGHIIDNRALILGRKIRIEQKAQRMLITFHE